MLRGNRWQNCNSKFYQKHPKHSISTITEMFISQTVTAVVLRGMCILLAQSLFNTNLGSFFGSGSLFLGSVLKKGNECKNVFCSLVFFLLKAICNGSAFVKMA